ncbi:MAG: tetratricopeptide repeat protein [Oryzomonas sp.]|uniref:tetratricopeptide repeat protein n=1 Tax=Oryzomonas sp. TaxID=2855186 RepID=UPI00283BE729|nr:tetratricopeptide repeat protein [Oryzomonas sp.]MDR3578737.1 tetratricopeptide repeat protein [Oryzomonas sp.]
MAIGAFLINQSDDYDVWWHVVIGKNILSDLSIPTVDQFARASLGRPYHDSHWLFQIMLAVSDRFGGMVGVEAFMVAIWTATLAFCRKAASQWSSPLTSDVLLFLAAMASVERFIPRPEIISFLMISLFYLLLQKGKYKTWPEMTIFAALQAIWANSHGLFVFGPVMAGCYLLVAVVRFVKNKEEKEIFSLSRLMLVLLAGTLATPFGLNGWRYALLLFTEATSSSSVILKSVGELRPTFCSAAMSTTAFWFYVVLLVVAIIAIIPAALRKSVPLERLLIVCVMGAASLTGRRNVVLFALVAAPLISELLPDFFSLKGKCARITTVATTIVILAWSWYPLSGRFYLANSIPSQFGWGASPLFFPLGLPTFLERINFKGQVFNSNALGGFYLYHRYPNQIPLTDGRWEVYENGKLESIWEAPHNKLKWRQLIEAYDIRGLLIGHASPEAKALLPFLPTDSGWRLVYLDYAASFWLRTDVAPLPPAISLSAGTSLALQPLGVENGLMMNHFFELTGSKELQLRNLQQTLAFARDSESIPERIGTIEIESGKMAEAEYTFKELNQRYPKNIIALKNLAFLAYQRGDTKNAELLLRHVLSINPNDKESRKNLLLVGHRSIK